MAETFTSATNGPDDDAPFRSRLSFDLDVDICVVGAGLAGLTVALEAARLGASVAVLEGRHIGFQCHVEMTRELVTTWCDMAPDELPVASNGARQSRGDILRDLDARVRALNGIADGIYARWSQGLEK